MLGETRPVAAAVSNDASPRPDARVDAGEPARSSWRRVVAVLVLCSGLGLMVPAVVHSLRNTASLTSGPSISAGNGYYDQVTCYRATIEREVRKDARVYLGGSSPDEQLLVEASEMWATILPTPARAQYRISIVHGHGSCNGTSLVIGRP
jgi:hypothetical protein